MPLYSSLEYQQSSFLDPHIVAIETVDLQVDSAT